MFSDVLDLDSVTQCLPPAIMEHQVRANTNINVKLTNMWINGRERPADCHRVSAGLKTTEKLCLSASTMSLISSEIELHLMKATVLAESSIFFF